MVITHKLTKEEIEVLQWCVHRARNALSCRPKAVRDNLSTLLAGCVDGQLRVNITNLDCSAIDRPGTHDFTAAQAD